MTDAGEKLRKRLVTMWGALPHCVGYPNCDGDLEGEEHSPDCPRRDSPEITSVDFTEMCVRAELERAAEIADDEHGKAAGWEEQTDSNAAWYVKVTCERIASAIRKLKE